MSRSYAMWSPHRDSREVILWKSMLGFRPENWHWVDDISQARWYVVDVARGVSPDWTRTLIDRRSHVRGIALARQWTDVPAPCWTFFKVPLQHEHLSRWLDQLHPQRARRAGSQSASRHEGGGASLHTLTPGRLAPGERSAAGLAQRGGSAQPVHISWQGQLLRLTRWPDVNRYAADGSMELTIACARLLREWAPYDTVITGVSNQRALRSLLNDAQLNGTLRTMPAGQVTSVMREPVVTPLSPSRSSQTRAGPSTDPATAQAAGAEISPEAGPNASAAEQRRWSLLRRLWSRFA
jgi:hypothetical protein